jgi:hypothetical protein
VAADGYAKHRHGSDAPEFSIQFHWNQPAVPFCMNACFWAS